MIGTHLAHYQITGHLGKGGMGEVYQATDSRLGRSVAIKLLPDAFSDDSDRSARFEREARALASLNHPHVASIYGVEESSGRKFLIMEFVDGETLAERIARGAIPVNEALKISIQICQAMEAAHEKGIVHRDLKPANIKVTSEGNVKVLDFGLAKAFETEAPNADASQSPTLSMAATMQGVILGTAAYMSPEQAKSRAVDRRTDIFAFGAVLYEMLTGRPAFDGEDVADILSSVLKMEPDWSRLPADVPPGIHRLLRLCLQKDARNRRQTATDVRIDIEHALNPPALPATIPVRKSRERIAFAVAGISLIAVVGLLAAIYFRPVPTSSIASRFLIELPPEASLLSGTAASPFPTVSPDGNYIVFGALSAGAPRLWLRPIGSLAAQPIPGTEDIRPMNSNPFWSSDSRFIGFFAGGKLKKVAVAGGPAQTLCDVEGDAIAGTWNQNDVILFESSGSIKRVGGAGGIPSAVKTPDAKKPSSYKFPYFLPDGRHFLYLVTGTSTEVRVGDLDSDDDKQLFATNSRVLFAAPNYLLFIRDGTLMAQRFDADKLTLTGDVLPVAEQVAANPTNGTGAFSASANGTLVYRAGSTAVVELTKFDRSGKNLGIIRTNGNFIHPRLSPDKNSLVVERRDGGNGDIWMVDLQRGTSTRFTTDPGDDSWPIFSHDGKQIAFASDRGGVSGIYTKSVSGSGAEQLVHKAEGLPTYINSWSSEFLIYETTSSETGRDVWALPMTGDRKAFPVVNDKFTQNGSRLSPDGRWILYASNESGRVEIYVQAFPKSTGVRQVSIDGVGATVANWRDDGREIIFHGLDGKMMAVDLKLGATMEIGIPQSLFPLPGPVVGSRLTMSSDGQLFIMPLSPQSGDRPTVTTVLNWASDITK